MNKIQMHEEISDKLNLDYVNILEVTGDSYAKHRLEYGVTAFYVKTDEVKDELKMLVSKSCDVNQQISLVEKMAQLCLQELIELKVKKGMQNVINDIMPGK